MIIMRLNWHEDFIFNLASLIRPKVYVELGIQNCYLFNRIAPLAERSIGVDITPSAGNKMIKEMNAQFFNGTTQEYAKELEANPLQIDMLFIDADHSKEAVLQDFRDFFPFVVPHGLILLHDTHPENEHMMQRSLCETAYQAVEELSKETSLYEMMTIPISPGLTICRKRQTQLSWREE